MKREILSISEILSKHNIENISLDSRNINRDKNTVFFAVKGTRLSGNDFIADAIRNGAKFVVTEEKIAKNQLNKNQNLIYYVDDIKKALGEATKHLYPKEPKNLFAVTGTSGKTSTIYYVWKICKLLNIKAACFGTLGNLYNSESDSNRVINTTTNIINLRKNLDYFTNKGAEYIAFEASSIGIEQRRLEGLKANAAAFTSLGQDHLDYHKNHANYLKNKLRLFTDHLSKDGIAVVSDGYNNVIKYLKLHNINYITVGNSGLCKILSYKRQNEYYRVLFAFDNNNYVFNTNIIGFFQIKNLLIAVLLLYKSGIDIHEMVNILTNINSPPFRMESIKNNRGYNIFIDFAHTPIAIENALKALINIKKQHNSKLIIVFGCGGNRDKKKRSLMGAVADRYADIAIVTDDNPRFEDPQKIRSSIMASIKQAVEIGDRREAIYYAISLMEKNDILLIAGKGHEAYQIIGDKSVDFNDKIVVEECLQVR